MYWNDIYKEMRSSITGKLDNVIPSSSSNYATTSKRRKSALTSLSSKWKNIVYLSKHKMMHCLGIGFKNWHYTEAIKGYARPCSVQNTSPSTSVWNGNRWSSWWLQFFEIGYCGHPAFLYAHNQQEQSTKLILSNLTEEDHPFTFDTLNNKNIQLLCLYFFLQTEENII